VEHGAARCPAGEWQLLGVDLVKIGLRSIAAYHDGRRLVCRLHQEIFARMKPRAGGEIDLDGIRSRAAYRPEWQRVELFAAVTRRQEYAWRRGPNDRVRGRERFMTEISASTSSQDCVTSPSLELEPPAVHDPSQSYHLLLLRPGNRDDGCAARYNTCVKHETRAHPLAAEDMAFQPMPDAARPSGIFHHDLVSSRHSFSRARRAIVAFPPEVRVSSSTRINNTLAPVVIRPLVAC